MPEHIGRLTAAGYTKGSGVPKLRLEGTEETIVVEIPDGEGWFLWTPVGIVEERETWQEWWKRVLEGEIELPELYHGEGWWCSDKPVSFGLYGGQQAGDRDE